jgi:diguanylate cyclase (GGDEF)-like protein/putative nucleotidyltransferase with HDIG domain
VQIQRHHADTREVTPPGAAPTPAVSWRLLGLLFVASGALGLATLPFSQIHAHARWPIAAVAAVAIVGGAVAVKVAAQVPERLLIAGLFSCAVLVSVAVALSGGPDSPYRILYAWTGVEAWYFLRRRQAAWFTAAASAITAVTFALTADEGGAVAVWVMVTGTMVALGLVTSTLRERADALIETLSDRATRDMLTGLPNRRGYQERIEQELARSARHGTPVTIVLADIDNFKALNDAFGHRFGDRALEEFADLCRHELRSPDLVSRVGGEEFAIILPHIDERGALAVAERLRRAVGARIHAPDGRSLTASFGIASFPEHGSDPEVLLDHADQAMYAAKHLGRDRTVVFSDGLLAAVRDNAPPEQLQAVIVLAEALDLRDAGTAHHSQTVGRLCSDIAQQLGLPPERVERIRVAGVLHDIGKIGVGDHVLLKAGPLTEEECAEMRQHAELGARMVAAAGMEDISAWVLAHHERPDGRGYPRALPAEAIPLEALILAVGDAYEAMTADRPYRRAPGHEYAVAELRRGSGAQFDATVVEALLASMGEPGAGTQSSTTAAQAEAAARVAASSIAIESPTARSASRVETQADG